ncbi:sigma-70 region 4 domain-containing protein [Nocardia jiangxiensis]|uniref:sigma-70 region 4 domain-containing protein n=1 Tax=Nocardia jiangxiensis TaxID=282685 RepID=UPI0002DEFB9B|nr:sigma-70 region 4 domain-containing protein [Nocardia jiangxiensis]
MIQVLPRSSFDTSFRTITELIDKHPAVTGLVLAIIFVTVGATAIAIRRFLRVLGRRKWTGEQIITVIAAAIATGVSAQGMWVFMGDALHLAYLPRAAFFAFLELMVIQSALRARAAQRDGGSPGVDGIAMWALTCLSAALSATEADNLGMLLLRLSAPIVAAWGWERSMALERRQRTGTRSSINWRITPERILIRLGLADPNPDRNAPDAATQHSLVAVALAVDDARAVRDSARSSVRQIRRSQERLRETMRRAATSGDLVPTEGRNNREILVDHIAVLRSASALLDLDAPNPFDSVRTAAQPDKPRQLTSIEQTKTCTDNIRRPESERTDAANVRSVAHQNIPLNQQTAVLPVGDVWSNVAEKICTDHPARRRHRTAVEAILRLHHTEDRTYPEIARQVGVSKHAVGRVIRQARPYHPARTSTMLPEGSRDAA